MRREMKKKAHNNQDVNFFLIKKDDPETLDVAAHVIGDTVFIETADDSIVLSVDQAKKLSYFLTDRLVRVVDLD